MAITKNLLVFGAIGGTGRQVVEQALQARYRVTAVVRNPAAFSVQHPSLTVVQGDVLGSVNSHAATARWPRGE